MEGPNLSSTESEEGQPQKEDIEKYLPKKYPLK